LRKLFFISLFCFTVIKSYSQITIIKNDIVKANDTIRVSTASNINDFNYTATDTNYLWDFSALQSSSQRIEEYISVFRTGFTYNLYFADLPFNPNRANVAQATNLALPAIISSSDSYNFFDRNDNEFQQVGIGTTLNGIETAIRFDNNDVIYRFPMVYNNTDTSDSDYDISLAGLAYYRYTQTRINHIDGWGTIITPLDTFDVLRVKTTIIGYDSLFIDTLNFGFNLPRGTEVQYKWLAPGRKIPILQINTRSVFGNNFVISNFYQDKELPADTTSIFEFSDVDELLKLFPNPAAGNFYVQCDCKNVSSVMLVDVLGKIYTPPYVISQNLLNINFPGENVSSGLYTVQIIADNKIFRNKIILH
jgi:hypothetical protein